MTYIPNTTNHVTTLYDNTTAQTLTGTLSRFQSVTNPYCFYSTSQTHVMGNTCVHICTILTNDSDSTQPRTRISLSTEINRIGASLAHKRDGAQAPRTCLTSTELPFSLNATSIDTGDTVAAGNLNIITFRLKN
jgi:hypothetical protein